MTEVAEIKARIEDAEVKDFMLVMSQVLDEFCPEPGQKTRVVHVTIQGDDDD